MGMSIAMILETAREKAKLFHVALSSINLFCGGLHCNRTYKKQTKHVDAYDCGSQSIFLQIASGYVT